MSTREEFEVTVRLRNASGSSVKVTYPANREQLLKNPATAALLDLFENSFKLGEATEAGEKES